MLSDFAASGFTQIAWRVHLTEAPPDLSYRKLHCPYGLRFLDSKDWRTVGKCVNPTGERATTKLLRPHHQHGAGPETTNMKAERLAWINNDSHVAGDYLTSH
jgi:hypothetical protein